jgi:hypothetical protein
MLAQHMLQNKKLVKGKSKVNLNKHTLPAISSEKFNSRIYWNCNCKFNQDYHHHYYCQQQSLKYSDSLHGMHKLSAVNDVSRQCNLPVCDFWQ